MPTNTATKNVTTIVIVAVIVSSTAIVITRLIGNGKAPLKA